MSEKRYTIAVDFDGVIHRYDTPWEAAEVIPDPPVDGAIEWLNEMAKRFDIVIHTTRGKTAEGQQAVFEFLRDHGYASSCKVTAEKPPALVYIDDRAWRFDGSHFPTPHEIHQARPWHKVAEHVDEQEEADG